MRVKNIRKILIGVFLFACILTFSLSFMNKTYSYGLQFKITGEKGSRVLHYYDADSGTEITVDDTVNYYGQTYYYKAKQNGEWVYFYKAKETDENTYNVGNEGELADKRAKDYGENAYRIHSISDAMNVFTNIYSNLKSGKFRLEYSKYDGINLQELLIAFSQKYGTYDPTQNYYPYSKKGEFEPARFGLEYEELQEGEIQFTTIPYIRITGNEKKVVETFVNKLLPMLQGDGSDYEKIAYAYTYITRHTTYLTDSGFYNMVSSNTSVYDALISRQSVCIGYAITFSYLMDKLGIESYIVDAISSVDVSSQDFASNHSYNIVKLDGKFYKVDPSDKTEATFLKAIGTSELYDGTTLNISTTDYNKSGKLQLSSISFNDSTINSYLASAKGVSTTTTAQASITQTTQKTTVVPTTTTKKGETTAKGEEIITSGSEEEGTTIEVSTNEAGEAFITTQVYNPETGEYETITKKVTTTLSHAKSTTTSSEDVNLNYILVPALIIVVVLYVIYKVLTKKKTSTISSDEIQAMLYKQPNSLQKSQTAVNNVFGQTNNTNQTQNQNINNGINTNDNPFR